MKKEREEILFYTYFLCYQGALAYSFRRHGLFKASLSPPACLPVLPSQMYVDVKRREMLLDLHPAGSRMTLFSC